MQSDEAKQTPYWRSWVAHVAVLEVALRDEFHLSDVSLLDERIQEHHRLFLKVRFAPLLSVYYPLCQPLCYTLCYTALSAHSFRSCVFHR